MLHSFGILEQGFILLEAANVLPNTVQNRRELLENIDVIEPRLEDYISAAASMFLDRL